MSSLVKKMQKKINESKTMEFDEEMYNNCYGSVVICYMILQSAPCTVKRAVKARWNEIKADPDSNIDFIWDDPQFVEKTLALFNLPLTDNVKNNICMVKSKYNVLFAPYYEGKVLPLREDGFMGRTLKTGEVTYPLFKD